ncbi:MAG: hypothetical protein HY866_12060 [Chloroflexi bacterium]|nr:hypothetical protein [Chloroflexota bacterium]
MAAVENRFLQYVQEGMKVYDRQGSKVGKVIQVYSGAYEYLPGEKAVALMDLDKELLPDAVRGLFSSDRFPAEVRERLLQIGFIKIDTGLFASDRYALGDQVDMVHDDGVYLRVDKDETLKF